MKLFTLLALATVLSLFPVALAGAKMNVDAAPIGDKVLVQDAPASSTVPAVELGYSVPEPIGSITVTSHHAAKVPMVHAKKSLHAVASTHQLRFVCGAAYDNAVGGRNSDCSWQ